jgi:sigma54-dependent transcription regulator
MRFVSEIFMLCADEDALQAKAVREKTKFAYCSGLACERTVSKFRRMSTMSPTALVRFSIRESFFL